MKSIQTTVFTGALGSGKTTIISSLVSQFPENYSAIWLKNEYGDVNVDSALANDRNIVSKEILNGCLCCVLIGKLSEALKEIVNDYEVDRLIIETAGTAYPYPIVKEISKLPELELDGLVMVIDALNFEKFSDKSALAKSQAEFIDLIVINKTGLIDQVQLDRVDDEVYDLYPGVPKIYTKDGSVDKSILVGLDSKQIKDSNSEELPEHIHHTDEVDVINFVTEDEMNLQETINYIKQLNSEDFYRIKGILLTKDGAILINSVLGRITTKTLSNYDGATKLALMGRGISTLNDKVLEALKSFQI